MTSDTPVLSISADKFSLAACVLDVKQVVLGWEPPLCAAVCGDWGSGKTSFMHFLREAVSEEAVSIWFDAWRYEGAGLLYSLVRHIAKEHYATPAGRGVVRGVLAIGGAAANLISMGGIKNVKERAEIGYSIGADALKAHETKYDAISNLKTHYRELEAGLLHLSGKNRIIVFLDDLDRCSPENAVTTLEALKNHFVAESTVFVVGIDSLVVGRALQARYHNFEMFDAEAYLDKVFRYRLRLPGCRANALKQLLEGFDLGPHGEDWALIAAKAIEDCGVPNPRRAKILGYRLEQLAPILPRLFEDLNDNPRLLRSLTALLVLNEFFPDAYVALRSGGRETLALLPAAMDGDSAASGRIMVEHGVFLKVPPLSDVKVQRVLRVVGSFRKAEEKTLNNLLAVIERTPRRQPATTQEAATTMD